MAPYNSFSRMNRSTILQAADPPSDESPRREAQPEKKKTASMRNNRHRIPKPLASVTLAMLLALPVMSAQTGTAFAEDRRFYVDVTVPVERLDTSYKKTVDNTHPSNRVPEPRRGMVFHDGDSDDTFAYGIGLLAGYRLPLTESGFYLSGEVDLAFHGGKTKGQLRGLGLPQGAINPGKAGRTAGPSKKTEATASRSSWAAAQECCGHGTRASTHSEASVSSKRSLRTTIT